MSETILMLEATQSKIEVKGRMTECGNINRLHSHGECTDDHLEHAAVRCGVGWMDMEGGAVLKRGMARGQQPFVHTSSSAETTFGRTRAPLHFRPSFLPSFFPPFLASLLLQRRWRSDVWKQAKLEIHSIQSFTPSVRQSHAPHEEHSNSKTIRVE